ncbi:MAG: DUF349 domain-containing protein [Bowdeniella nasicola]|nr:DUF349 domain-containing protein [Bowdeniella nasicola]
MSEQPAEKLPQEAGTTPVEAPEQTGAHRAPARAEGQAEVSTSPESAPEPTGQVSDEGAGTHADGVPSEPAEVRVASEPDVSEAHQSAPAPQAPTPIAVAPVHEKKSAATPIIVAAPTTDASQAAEFGRVDPDGTVYVRDEDAERVVGQFPEATTEEALAFYVQRYLDLEAELRLAEARLPHLGPKDVDQTVATLQEQVASPAAVGDLAALRARVATLAEQGAERKAQAAAEREAAKAAALERREAIVAKVEEIAARDPHQTQWRKAGEAVRGLLNEWKSEQRRGPRLERRVEDALWKRFSRARTTFDRNRRQFFAELDARHAKVRAAKEALIERAAAMNDSTDWGRTTIAYRALMDEWKAAGRTHRKEDNELWARFRAAQQVFFDARNAANAQTEQEERDNLEQKRALLERAEALLPITDPKAARAALRPIQEEFEEIGFVPRSALSEVEGRMRAVEDAIHTVEAQQWRDSDPEVSARRNALTSQIEEALAELDERIAQATAAGDDATVTKLTEERATKQAWLDQIS